MILLFMHMMTCLCLCVPVLLSGALHHSLPSCKGSAGQLTLLLSEWPKLHRVLAILSATGLKLPH